MVSSLVLILCGLLTLAGGGELLLRGAVGLARRFSLTPAVIGLTVVAAGTSIPELSVSLLAAYRGSTDIAVANVVGSNILNITLILGLAALIRPLAVTGNMIRLEYPVLALVTLLSVTVFDDGVVSRLDGLLFICTYVGFTTYLVSIVRERMLHEETKGLAEEVAELAVTVEPVPRIKPLVGLLASGVTLLALGAELTVRGAVDIGRLIGLSERVIGLTIVSCGTSLPEIVTSLVAGARGRDDVAIGNVIGSNLFNILGILGLSSLLVPIAVSPELRSYDAYWMLGVTAILFPLMRSGLRINRREGMVLLAVFATYIFLLI